MDWTGTAFLDNLFQFPNLCSYYFSDEELPPIVSVKRPQELINHSKQLGRQFGIQLEIKIKKEINTSNPSEVADLIKDAILQLNNIDVNILALLYQKISMFFFSIERSEDALMFLNKSLDITPKNIGALLNKGYILEKINQVEESTKCYDEILEINEKNKFALNNKAHNLMREGNFTEALSYINKALDSDSHFIIAIQNKAEILKAMKKTVEALKFLELGNIEPTNSVKLQITKIGLYIDIIDLRKAYDLNELILKKDPSNLVLLNNKGVIFEHNAKFQKPDKYLPMALEAFEKLISFEKKFPLAWSNKLTVLITLKKFDEAEELVNTSYFMFPDHPYILDKTGLLLLIKGKAKQAMKYFERARRLMFQEEFLLHIAEAHLALRHYEDAKKVAERVIKYNPSHSSAWAVKGEALHSLRRPCFELCFKNAKKYTKYISLLED